MGKTVWKVKKEYETDGAHSREDVRSIYLPQEELDIRLRWRQGPVAVKIDRKELAAASEARLGVAGPRPIIEDVEIDDAAYEELLDKARVLLEKQQMLDAEKQSQFWTDFERNFLQ